MKEENLKFRAMAFHESEFENLVADIFTYLGWSCRQNVRDTVLSAELWDLVCEKDNLKCYIEIKSYRQKYMETGRLKNILWQVESRDAESGDYNLKVLVTSNVVRKEDLCRTLIGKSVIIVDIGNLLYLVDDNDFLKDRLMSFIEYTVNDIHMEAPDERIMISPGKEKDNSPNDVRSLIRELESWNDKKSSGGEYEKLCCRVLKKIFMNDLSRWEEQRKSNVGLFRFDLICKIKDDEVSPFWKFIENFFESKYVVFEFKNYRSPITQKEIFTTARYLYARALRRVAIIVSANGWDEHSYTAVKGILRDEGKLVILLQNEDMIRMLEKVENGEEPSDYIYDKLDRLLIELDK